MRAHLFAFFGLTAALLFASTCAAQAQEPSWEALSPITPGMAAAYYSPSTARTETDRGATIRAVDVKFEAVNGDVSYETWKVNADTCSGRLVDVAIYKNGAIDAFQRSLSPSRDLMAQAACGRALNF